MADYPEEPATAPWVRFPAMIFGACCVLSGLAVPFRSFPQNPNIPDQIGIRSFMFLAGLIVGAGWFGYGYLGHPRLFETLPDWKAPTDNTTITAEHQRGLAVLKKRRLLSWISVPLYFVVAFSLMPLFLKAGFGGVGFILIAIGISSMQFYFYLSRCPRCGRGFSVGTSSQQTTLRWLASRCVHCGLTLSGQNGWKD